MHNLLKLREYMNLYINFDQIEKPKSQNYFIACPKGKCNITPDFTVETYPVPVAQLKELWANCILAEPRFKLVHVDSDNQFTYVQRSAVFRFPDFITIRFYALSDSTSSLAIYSRARYGYYDFGVNKRRVLYFLKKLNIRLKQDGKE